MFGIKLIILLSDLNVVTVWICLNFLLIDETDKSEISNNEKHNFFAVSLFPLSFFANILFKAEKRLYPSPRCCSDNSAKGTFGDRDCDSLIWGHLILRRKGRYKGLYFVSPFIVWVLGYTIFFSIKCQCFLYTNYKLI